VGELKVPTTYYNEWYDKEEPKIATDNHFSISVSSCRKYNPLYTLGILNDALMDKKRLGIELLLKEKICFMGNLDRLIKDIKINGMDQTTIVKDDAPMAYFGPVLEYKIKKVVKNNEESITLDIFTHKCVSLVRIDGWGED